MLKRKLSYLILGQKGGRNRIQIIELLKDRPYNLNQLAGILELNYRTVKHHVDVLLKNELISSSRTGGYGEVYFLTPEMEGNMDVFRDVIIKLTDFTSSKKFFKNIMEQTNDAVIIINEDSDIYFWNNGAEKIYGFKEEEVLGKTLPIFPDSETARELMHRAAGGEQIAAFEATVMHSSKEPIDVSLTMDGIRDENENIIGYSIISRDITERRRTSAKLKASEERYALAQRAANIGSWDWNIITGKLHWSDTIEPMFGFGPGNFGRSYEAFLDCVHPDDRQFVVDRVNAAVEDYDEYDIEHRIVWPDGEVRIVSETGEVFREKDGKAVRMVGVVQDITARKQAERELRNREKELSAILKNVPIPMMLVDEDRRIREVNEEAVRFTGNTEDRMIDQLSGNGLGCLHSLEDPKGCGFGPHCEGCDIRSTIMDTLDTGKNHHGVRTTISMAAGDGTKESDILISTTSLNIMGARKVLVSIEAVDGGPECGT